MEARSLKEKTTSEQDTIAKLQKQLDTLINAKQDYETELLTKVRSSALSSCTNIVQRPTQRKKVQNPRVNKQRTNPRSKILSPVPVP